MAKVYSGINYIDGLLSSSGQSTTPVNSWSTETTVGSGVSLTYDWMTSAPGNAPAGGFQPFSAAQQAGAEAAMNLFAEVADITFTQTSVGTADLEFGTVSFGGSPSGYIAGQAWTSWTILGQPAYNTYYTHSDIYLTNSFASMSNQTPGSSGFATMLHEIGHALGLTHPFENVISPAPFDTEQYTLMAYDSHPDMNANPSSPLLHDIAALQYLYGANMTTRTGADTYSWDLNEAAIMAIWDAGGVDVIDASNQVRDVKISLEAGSFSSIGSNGSGGNAVNNIAIAYGAIIENAEGGTGDDELVGNDQSNELIGNSGSDHLEGAAGDDLLEGGGGDDDLFGGIGLDTVRLLGDFGDFDIAQSLSGGFTTEDLDTADGLDEGLDTIDGSVELLTFGDDFSAKYVLDVAGTASWYSFVDGFNDLGQRVERSLLLDNGNTRDNMYENGGLTSSVQTDEMGILAWTTQTNFFGGDGTLTQQVLVWDTTSKQTKDFEDGVLVRSTRDDIYDRYIWQSNEANFDAAGNITSSRIEFDSGDVTTRIFENGATAQIIVEDINDSRSWQTTTRNYDADGDLTSQKRLLDTGLETTSTYTDGSVTQVDFNDLSNLRSWETLSRSYEVDGTLTELEIVWDTSNIKTNSYTDGDLVQIFDEDIADLFGWQTRTRDYEEGVLTTETFLNDDGSTRVIDHSDNDFFA